MIKTPPHLFSVASMGDSLDKCVTWWGCPTISIRSTKVDNKEKITGAILFRNPALTIADAGSLYLKIELDLFNGHIEWFIEQDDLDIFYSYDSAVAIDKFCELAEGLEVNIHI